MKTRNYILSGLIFDNFKNNSCHEFFGRVSKNKEESKGEIRDIRGSSKIVEFNYEKKKITLVQKYDYPACTVRYIFDQKREKGWWVGRYYSDGYGEGETHMIIKNVGNGGDFFKKLLLLEKSGDLFKKNQNNASSLYP